MKLGGPYWAAPIHDQTVVDALLQKIKIIQVQQQQNEEAVHDGVVVSSSSSGSSSDSGSGSSNGNSSSGGNMINYQPSTISRMIGVLSCISEELKDVVFYYRLPELASTVKVHTPRIEQMRAALFNAGMCMCVCVSVCMCVVVMMMMILTISLYNIYNRVSSF